MCQRSPLPLCALALVVLGGAPVSAANPKLSLKLERVTCQEAVAALAKAAAMPIELRELPMQPDAERLGKRANFDWSTVRLGQAMRELCREYDLSVNRFGGTYSLMPNGGAPPIPVARPKGMVEKDGVRLSPSSLSVSSNRTINFEREGEPHQSSNLNLRLKIEWPTGDPETLAGFDNLVARDDLGNVLAYQQRGLSELGGIDFGSRFPDEWSVNVSLADPHPRARKIQWLEGDLLVYKLYRAVTLEVPFAEKSTTGVARAGQVQAEILGMDPGMAGVVGPTVRARVFLPQSERVFSAGAGRMFTPVLVGASGKRYSSRGGGSSGRGGAEGTTYTLNSSYLPIDEPIVKAVFSFVEKGEPQKLLTFRMTNIPFPPDGVFVPRQQAPPRAVNAPPKPERPFFQDGGGSLVFRTEIAGKPVGEGSLSVGLAPKAGAEGGAVRWQEVDVDNQGLARLSDIKPGVYRLLRIYRPKAATVVEGEGRWENGESEVALVAGKEASLAPLRWVLDGKRATPALKPPPPRSGGGVPKRPAVK